MKTNLKDFLLHASVSLAIAYPFILGFYFYDKSIQRELSQRQYVIPNEFYFNWNRPIRDIDGDGLRESIAKYRGTNYLFKVGTNGIPYLEPIRR